MSLEEKYKIALFMVIRNSTVMPKGISLGKNMKEINEMSYATMQEMITSMIDFNSSKILYEDGKKEFERNKEQC